MRDVKKTAGRPLVSVVVPCFNAEAYLRDSIGSLVGQTYGNLELLVVDDGSTDGSAAILAEWAATEPRLRLIVNGRHGANSARQAGVAAATGEFILFMDADDAWVPAAVERLLGVATEMAADLVCCTMEMRTDGGCGVPFTYRTVNQVITGGALPDALLDVLPSVCAKLFRAAKLKKLVFDDVPFAQDWNITYKALVGVTRLVFINEPLYVYVRRRGSTCSLRKAARLSDIMAAERALDGILQYVVARHGCRPSDYPLPVLEFRFYLHMLVRSYWLESREEQDAFRRHVRARLRWRHWLDAVWWLRTRLESAKLVYFLLLVFVAPAYRQLERHYKRRYLP